LIRAIRTLAAASFAVLTSACSWQSGGIEWTQRRAADAMLTRAARAGYPARLVILPAGSDVTAASGRLADEAGRDGVSVIVLSPGGVRVVPSPAYGRAVPASRRRAIEEYALADYVRDRDMDAAAPRAVREYLETLVTAGAIDPSPLPLVEPAARYRRRDPFTTAIWGTPVAVLLGALALFVNGAAASPRVLRERLAWIGRALPRRRSPTPVLLGTSGAFGVACAACALGVLVWLVACDGGHIGHDQAMYLQSGDEILSGRLPFVDFVDVNPPAIMFLHVAPALLWRWTGWPAARAFQIFVLLFAVMTTVGFRSLCSLPALTLTRARAGALLAAYALISGLAWVLDAFGQREHFMILLLLPWVVVRWARLASHDVPRPHAALVGLGAGIALAVKPQFALPLAAIEACSLLAARSRWARRLAPEWAGFAAAMAAYAALFAAFPPMAREFFGVYVPIFWRGYGAYDGAWRDLLLRPEHLLAGVVLVWAILLRRWREPLALPTLLGAFLVALDFAFLLQRKGWAYQAFPVTAAAGLWLVAALPSRPRVLGAVSLGGLALLLALAATPSAPSAGQVRSDTLTRYVSSHTEAGDAVLVLSSEVLGPYPTLLTADRRPGSRFVWLPLLPMAYRGVGGTPFPYRRWDEASATERILLDRLVEDIRARAPALILVDSSGGPGLPTGFRIDQWLEATGLVNRAMAAYARFGRVEGFEVWRKLSPALSERASSPERSETPLATQ
jgi:hypothetical protein